MAFAACWTRASLRQSWRTLGGIALLFAIIGGLSLFCIAGARRTQSAYPRFLSAANPSTMAVDVGGLDADGYRALDVIAHLPQVAQARAYAAFYVARWADGRPDFSQNFEAVGSLDGRYFDQDRFTPISGRLPDPNRADEVAVNEESAWLYGYHVGQKLDFATVSRSDVEDGLTPEEEREFQPRLLIPSTIVGVGAFVEEVTQDDTDRSPLVLFTPAYVKEAKGLELYAWQGLVLRNGDADVAAVKQTITELSGGGPQIFRVTSTDTFHAQQAMRPVSLALATFGIIVGLACLVLVGQALCRHIRSERIERGIARSLGATPLQIAAVTAIGPAITVVVGLVLAVVLAVAASPAMPIGLVRRVEAAPGISADWTVLGLGALGSIAVLLAVIGVVVWRETPHRVQQRAHTARVSRVAALASANLPPTAATGLRFSFVPGQGSAAVPVRSVMAGAVIAVAALMAAVTFGASLRHLVSNPRLFGWNWDVALVDGAGYGNSNPRTTAAVFASDENIEAWGGAYFGAEDVNGVNVPLLGIDPSSALSPPLLEGRMVGRPGEIVLGTATLARLHVDIGDTVQTSSGPAVVVGSATFPTIGVVHGDHTSLGVGGIVVPEQVPGYDRNREGGDLAAGAQGTPADEYGPNILFVRFRPGTDHEAAVTRLSGEIDQIADYNGITMTTVQRSAEIVNADDIGGSSILLGAAVALSALASLILALTAAVRRRRRDLALLKALGFTRRQISATIAWQATSTVAVGLVIGVPVGIAAGRLMWTLFARQLDVVAEPAVPFIVIGLIVLAALVAANALAALPGRTARSVPAALVVRGE